MVDRCGRRGVKSPDETRLNFLTIRDVGKSLRHQEPSVDAAEPASTTGPDFVVTWQGDAIPIPQQATGPTPVRNGKGFQYTGGSGGHGFDPRTAHVRIMDPTPPRGTSAGYPAGYVSYSNARGQPIEPYTGRTLSRRDARWHIALTF